MGEETMIYKFKSKFIEDISAKQETYIEYKKLKYSLKNKNKQEPYRIAENLNKLSLKELQEALEFAELSDIMVVE